jgi:tripartite-type tricarboxylate transporter receptor subunit TctC
LYKTLPYDSIRDFAPVTVLQSVPMVIVVPTASPIRTVSDIVQMSKAKHGAISYASFGAGSMSHLAGELMKMMGNFEAVHVPYKGGGPALTDTIAGQVMYYYSGVNSALPHINSGRLRAIAVTSAGRSRALPTIPAVAETAEFKGYEAVVPTGVWLPANTPAAIVQALHTACVKVVRSSEYQKALDAEGSEPIASTPDQMLAAIKRDTELLAKVIRQANVKVD